MSGNAPRLTVRGRIQRSANRGPGERRRQDTKKASRPSLSVLCCMLLLGAGIAAATKFFLHHIEYISEEKELVFHLDSRQGHRHSLRASPPPSIVAQSQADPVQGSAFAAAEHAAYPTPASPVNTQGAAPSAPPSQQGMQPVASPAPAPAQGAAPVASPAQGAAPVASPAPSPAPAQGGAPVASPPLSPAPAPGIAPVASPGSSSVPADGVAAAAERDPQCKGFSLQDGTDLPGHDLKKTGLHGGSAEACCRECSAVPDCTAFTYIKDNGMCWLKGGRGASRREPNAVLGLHTQRGGAVIAAAPKEAVDRTAFDPRADLSTRLLAAVQNRQAECTSQHHVGGAHKFGQEDGAWDICFERLVTPCVVYSFGIADDWSFDKALAEFGCEVHSFDPSIGMADHDPGKNLHFHNMGLHSEDNDQFAGTEMASGQAQTWKVRTLESIMRELGHDRVDVVKVDVEGGEWDVLESLQRSSAIERVGQLTFEVHFWENGHKGGMASEVALQRWLSTLQGLSRTGLQLFHTHQNPLSTWEDLGQLQRTACCFELSFLRPSA